MSASGKVNRVMLILQGMSIEEREEVFGEIGEIYCVGCGAELPDEDSKEPDHDCPNAEDDEDEDDEDEEEDEEIDTTSEA